MGKVVVVTSGKGGVGKTTSTAALGAALAQDRQEGRAHRFRRRPAQSRPGHGRRAARGVRPRQRHPGAAKLSQALIRDKRLDTLFLLPASQTRDKDALTEEGVADVIAQAARKVRLRALRQPGRHRARRATRHALCRRGGHRHQSGSVVGARFRPHHRPARLPDLEGRAGRAASTKHVLVTRYDAARAARGEMLSIDDVLEILSTPLLGIIPESQGVLRASNLGSPVTLTEPPNAAGARLYRRGKAAGGRGSADDRAGRRGASSTDFLGRRAA